MTKKIIGTLLQFGVLVALCACDTSDNFGYPSKIAMTHEGCERIVTGEVAFDNIEIANYNGDGSSVSPNPDKSDSLTISYDWLTIKAKNYDRKLLLIAQPNKSGKRRKLYVMGSSGNDLIEIKVEQP